MSRLFSRGGDTMPNLVLDHEPHTALLQSDGKGENSKPSGQWYPFKHRRDSIGWRGIPQLLALGERRKNSRPPIALQALGDRLEILPPSYRVTVLSMYVEYGGQGTVFKEIATDSFPLPIRAFGEKEIDVRDMLVDLVHTAERVAHLVRTYAANVYAVTQRDIAKNKDPKKERIASKAYAGTVVSELNYRIDGITRRLLTDLSANPDAMDELRSQWNARIAELGGLAVDQVNADCGSNVFALITRSNNAGARSVAVKPPAILLDQLRSQLSPLLGEDNEEVSA